MTARTPVRLASLTKTFTAAAVPRLWEMGRLSLDTPIVNLITPELDRILRGGGYDTGAITVRHLLMHAGGLADHAESPAYLGAILADPGHVWTRTEQVALMLELGPPLSHPGTDFAYSDTGYVLLGGIVERATGQPLGPVVRDLLRWDALGLPHVRWEGEPPAQGPARAHQWMDGFDTTSIHGSIDAFGGGGIVASIEDAARLYAALVCGATFDRPDTLDLMLATPGRPAGSPYRMGLFGGEGESDRVFRHVGYWGLHAAVLPDRQVAIAAVGLDRAMTQEITQMVESLARALQDGL
ncbi:MAG: beta-lactamase family protein [Rhodobacteraceae bacterium]|nr:beta-lactamase family protein [Paracoccaceae bacterium]